MAFQDVEVPPEHIDLLLRVRGGILAENVTDGSDHDGALPCSPPGGAARRRSLVD